MRQFCNALDHRYVCFGCNEVDCARNSSTPSSFHKLTISDWPREIHSHVSANQACFAIFFKFKERATSILTSIFCSNIFLKKKIEIICIEECFRVWTVYVCVCITFIVTHLHYILWIEEKKILCNKNNSKIIKKNVVHIKN